MVDKTLTQLRSTNPVTASLTGSEPLETVVSAVSEAAILKQLSFAPIGGAGTSTYTLDVADQGRVVAMTSSSPNIVTVPLNAVAAFPINATLLVRQSGAGATSIAASAGVTIQRKASITLSVAEQHGQIVLHKVAIDTWHTTGEYLAV